MENKIEKQGIWWISVISVGYTLFNLIIQFKMENNYTDEIAKVWSGFFLILIAIVGISVVIKCNRIKRVFVMLYCMGENNKLHPLREFVLVAYDQMFHSDMLYDISKAEFSYILKEAETPGNYDVEYDIKLALQMSKWDFLRRRWNVKRQEGRSTFTYSTYIIWDALFKIEPSQLINVSYGKEAAIAIEAKSVTLSLNDTMYEEAGLYKVEMEVPISAFVKQNHGYGVTININYCIESNFKLKLGAEDKEEYSFVIIPINYGRKIKECVFRIQFPNDDDLAVECYKIYDKGKIPRLDKYMEFEETGEDKEHCPIEGTFKPQNNSIYFLRLVPIKRA